MESLKMIPFCITETHKICSYGLQFIMESKIASEFLFCYKDFPLYKILTVQSMPGNFLKSVTFRLKVEAKNPGCMSKFGHFKTCW